MYSECENPFFCTYINAKTEDIYVQDDLEWYWNKLTLF